MKPPVWRIAVLTLTVRSSFKSDSRASFVSIPQPLPRKASPYSFSSARGVDDGAFKSKRFKVCPSNRYVMEAIMVHGARCTTAVVLVSQPAQRILEQKSQRAFRAATTCIYQVAQYISSATILRATRDVITQSDPFRVDDLRCASWLR